MSTDPDRDPDPHSGREVPETGYAERRVPALEVVLAGGRAVLRVPTRTSVAGSPPATGGCIVAANHLSLLDPCCWAQRSTPRAASPGSRPRRPWSEPALGYVQRACEQIPVRRDGGRAVEAVDPAVAAAAADRCVVVYPEGRITRDPPAGRCAPAPVPSGSPRRPGCRLVPPACWGTNLVLPLGVRLPHPVPRRTCSVVFGEPVAVADLLGRRADPPARSATSTTSTTWMTSTSTLTQAREQARAATEALSDLVDALLAIPRGGSRPGPRLDVRRPGHPPR